jgi:hypothetical protein
MKLLTLRDRDQLERKRRLYIPLELVYQAETWEVSIRDTCIEALQRQIHAQKKAHYLALNQPAS